PATSVAVDLAGACTGADQRDLPRPQGAACDAGAYEVDQAPDTRIDSGPPAFNNGTVTFAFSSPEPGTTFQCKLGGPAGIGVFAACASPTTFASLASGIYTFSVRALDGTGHVDATPASQTFSVDSTPPGVNITGG